MKKQDNAKIVLVCGLIAITAAFLTVISDVILLGRPVSAYSFIKTSTQSMVYINDLRLLIGTFSGIIALPFQIFGLAAVYYGLKNNGKVLTMVTIFTTAHALIMGVAFHTPYVFIGTAWKTHYNLGMADIFTSILMKKFDFYWWIIAVIILAELMISSICFSYIILRKKVLFPKWMAAFNPLFISIYIYPFIAIIPAPLGGFIAPAYLNISTMIFLILSTYVVYKRIKSNNLL